MWTAVFCGVVLLCIWMWHSSKEKGDLARIPGPKIHPWWDLITLKKSDHLNAHNIMSTLAQKYGPIMKIPDLEGPMVVVSDLKHIYQVCVTSGKEFGARNDPNRINAVYSGTGIVHSAKADIVWKTLRKVSQRHLKQFGDGMSHLEDVIIRVSDESMFSSFAAKKGSPFDPREIIFETAIKTMIFLISGDLSDEDFERITDVMRKYLFLVRQCHGVVSPISYKLLDVFPWLRFFGIGPGATLQRVKHLLEDIWTIYKETNEANPDNEGIFKVFKDYRKNDEGDYVLSDVDVRNTCILLLLAGVITTTDTFHAMINVLAHHKNVQAAIFEEIQKTTDGSAPIKLAKRSAMHYSRATLLESLRYTSVAAFGVGHECATDANLQGYQIPKGTKININLWHLHHDPEFWEDPHEFRPERFLDDNNEVVAADHPNRTHLMPFGAGMRVCVAETLASTRLFLWLVTLIRKFEIIPAEGHLKSSATSNNFVFDGLICAKPYDVILNERA